MPVEQNKIAIVFDFDDTLTEDTLTRLLSQKGVDVDAFWLEDVALKCVGAFALVHGPQGPLKPFWSPLTAALSPVA